MARGRKKGDDEHGLARSGGWALGEQIRLPSMVQLEKLDLEQLEQRARSAFGHIHRRAIEAGVYLTQIKAKVGGESWEGWCLRHWNPFGRRSADRCIAASREVFAEIAAGKTAEVAIDTAVQALRAIGMVEREKVSRPAPEPPPVIDAEFEVREAEDQRAQESHELEQLEAHEAELAAAAERHPQNLCTDCGQSFTGEPLGHVCPRGTEFTGESAEAREERELAEQDARIDAGMECYRCGGPPTAGDPIREAQIGTRGRGEPILRNCHVACPPREEEDEDEDAQAEPAARAGPGPRVAALDREALRRMGHHAISEEERAQALKILREHPLDTTAAALLVYSCGLDEILPNPGAELGLTVALAQDALTLLQAVERAIHRLALPRIGVSPSDRRALQGIRDALGTGLCPSCDAVIQGPLDLATQAVRDACGTAEERAAAAAAESSRADYRNRTEKARATSAGKKGGKR